MYYIYKATNKVNGKIYIGQTVNFERRKREHLSSKNGVHYNCGIFHKAIKKYGKENFEWEIIDKCKTPEEATELESLYIIKYNSCISFEKSNGYNILLWQERWKIAPNSIKVLAYDMQGNYIGTYQSCGEAARELNCLQPNILKCLRGKRKSTGGYQFKKYEKDFPLKISPYSTNEQEAKYKAVYQYDKTFLLVKKHHSLQECADEMHVARNSITIAIKKKRPCKNYYFSYAPL